MATASGGAAASGARGVAPQKYQLTIQNAAGKKTVEVESLGDRDLADIPSIAISGSVVHAEATASNESALLDALKDLGVTAESAENVNLSA